MAEIAPASEDLFFNEVVRGYVEGNRRFIRRPWLADFLEEKLRQANRPFILMTAEPGAGKSAFVAQLADDHPNWLRYFIRRDQRSVLADVSTKSFLLRIGYQLAARQPTLFSLGQLSVSIQQRIGEVADRGEVIGAEIARLTASPFYQHVLHIDQHVRAHHGKIVGLRVEELVADTRLLTLEDLLHLALLDPARALQRADPMQRIVVLVDALDEIRYHSASENILGWLTNCPALLENIRFVLTSRPPDEPLKLFCAKQSPRLTALMIAKDNPNVKQDIERFVERLVGEEGLARAFQLTEGGAKLFAQRILAKAHGNLGYLDAIARAIDQAIDAGDTHKVQALLNLKELPSDLEGLYAFFLSQIKVTVVRERIELRDPDTGETYDKDVWPAIYVRILGVLAVATEPLSLDLIERLGQIRAERSWIIQALGRLMQFLEITNGRYRLYHASVAEFLTDPRTAAKSEIAFLYQNAQQWHSRISDEYWYYRGNWAKCDEYGLSNLAMHLALSGQTDRLLTLLDLEWMRARYERSGYSYEGFLADIDVTQTSLAAHDALRPASLTRLASMRHVVRNLVEDLTDEDVETLVFLGREREALAHVRLRRTISAQCQGMLKMHKAALKVSQGNALLLEEALRLAQAIEDARDRAAALLELGEAHGKEPDVFKAIFEEARRSIALIEDTQRRWYALRDAINCLVRCGFCNDAEQLLGTLSHDVETTEAFTPQGSTLGGDSVLENATSELVKGLAECGEGERAESLIVALKKPIAVACCLAILSMIRTKHGDDRSLKNAEEAYEIALHHAYGRDRTLPAAATALRLCGDARADTAFSRALEEARAHPESADKAVALSHLAREYYAADPTRALVPFAEARAVAAEGDFQPGQQRAIEAIILDLSSVGEYKRAVDSAALVAEPKARTILLSKLLLNLTTVGEENRAALDMALAAFDSITDNSDRVTAGHLLALNLARNGDPRGPSMFRTVQELSRLVSPGDFDRALARWAPVFAKAGQFDRVNHIVQRIKGSLARKEAIEESINAIIGLESIEGVKALAFELENDNSSVVTLIDLASVLLVRESSDAQEIFEKAAIMAISLPESCARAEATSYIALRLYERKDPSTRYLFDEAYREALDQPNRGKLLSHDRLTQTALHFALAERHEEAKCILQSFDANTPDGAGVREIVDALARRGYFRLAWQYANFIRRDESPMFFSQHDWALFDIAAALADVKRFNTAERIIESIRLPDAQVRGLCMLGLKLCSVDPVRTDAMLRRATNIARPIRDSLHSAQPVLLHLCLDLYRVNAKDAPLVLDETIDTIVEGGSDRDRRLHELTVGLCELRQSDSARRVAGLISDPKWRDVALQLVVDSLASEGRFNEARTELKCIKSIEIREWALRSLATSYADTGRFEDAGEIATLINSPVVSARLYCDMGLIASEKASDRAPEFFAKMGNLLTRVDDQETIVQLASSLAAAGKRLDAIASLSRCELDNFLGVLGEWAPLFEEEGAESIAILEEAARIAAWARPDWREVSLVLQLA